MRLYRLARGGAIGFALGLLLTTFGCAAFAAQNLHTGFQVVDWALGIMLLALPLALLFGVLRLAAIIASRLLRLLRLETAAQIARLVGHPLLATTVGIVVLIWLAPADGPVSLYHGLYYFESLIVIGALVGLLIGIGFSVPELELGPRATKLASAGTIGLALVIGMTTATWAALPGFGDAIVHEPAAAVALIPALNLPDPSQAGPYTVMTMSYGSGLDHRRAEYGAAADWITPTVDASAALGNRGPVGEPFASWFWGYDSAHLPLNGLVWYPAEATGALPLALIVHGNHAAAEYSDPGYAYLAEHLASRGIITASIDQNYLNGDAFFDYAGSEMGTRAWLLLNHLEQFQAWSATSGHPLEGRVDLGRVALMGHSRGGEAATVAAMLNQRPEITPAGLADVDRGFGVRAVVAIAPSDAQYSGPGGAARLHNVDYLAIQGARDGDLPAYTALQPYHRVELDEPGHIKVALYSARANHGRFNTIWDYGDAGPTMSWMLDRGSVLSPADQQRLAQTAIGAFLARSLQGETGYDAFFREPRSGRDWLPDDIIQTHWESSESLIADSMERIDDDRKAFTGFEQVRTIDPLMRDGTTQRDRAALLTWSSPASVDIPVDAALPTQLESNGSFVISMAPSASATVPVDATIALHTRSGETAMLQLSDVAPPRPLIPVQLWKLEGLGDRYLPEERHRWPAERFLQTYEIPLAAFRTAEAPLDPTAIDGVRISFDGSGSVYLDDIGFGNFP